jgi:hypothetical protein
MTVRVRGARWLVVGVLAATVLPGTAQAAPGGVAGQRWSVTGDQPGEYYGWGISSLADVTGDRAQEVIVGAPFRVDAEGHTNGRVDVLSGRTGALVWRFDGAPDDQLGFSMADAGDVNRDGVADILAGAPQGSGPCGSASTGPGRAYVYSGRTGRVLLALSAGATGDQFGYAVVGAGDVDRDGHADVLVTAQCAGAGAAYLYSGRTGRLLRTLRGDHDGDLFGSGAGLVGDVDRDRVADVVVGARDAGATHQGQAYVYSGRTGRRLFTLTGDAVGADLGWFFTGLAGDVNRDGVPDVYVGDFDAGTPNPAGGMFDQGRAYVFSGRTGRRLLTVAGAEDFGGLGPGRGAGDVDHDGYADVVAGTYLGSSGAGLAQVVSGRTGRVIRTYAGVIPGGNLGFDAQGLGDVNHDGRPDLVISAATADTVYVVST